MLLECYYCLFLRNKIYVTKWGSKASTFINFAYKPNNQTKQEFVQSLSTARWNVFSMLYCLFLRNRKYATTWGSKASTLIILPTNPTTKQSGNLYKFYPQHDGMFLACYFAYFLGTNTMQHNGVLKQEGEGKTTTPHNHPPRSRHRLMTILAKTEKRA